MTKKQSPASQLAAMWRARHEALTLEYNKLKVRCNDAEQEVNVSAKLLSVVDKQLADVKDELKMTQRWLTLVLEHLHGSP